MKTETSIDVLSAHSSSYSVHSLVEQLFDTADVRLNGNRPWDIQVHDHRLLQRIVAQGSIGIGESYMDGWWDCDELDDAFFRIMRVEQEGKFKVTTPFILPLFMLALKSKIMNTQSKSRAFTVGEKHYDIGNDLYHCMLDKRMIYTEGGWENATDLDEAQEAKLELICRKLKLKSGMHVLDIGCGWGGFAQYAAERYGVSVTGVTVSRRQAELARKICEGLDVYIQLKDYRDIEGTFDRVVSIGMFEHVGYKNYKTYMQTAHRCLKDGGLFVLRTIGGNKSTTSFDPWMDKYIFPNAMIPSIEQIGKSYEGLFVMEEWDNFSTDYDKTLMAWFKNFDASWDYLKSNYDTRFYRMWKYYLLSCAALFRSRREQAWQIVFSKHGELKGYRA